MMPNRVELSRYDAARYRPARGFLIRALWHVVNHLVIRCYLNPSSGLRKRALTLFGAKIGRNVVLRPGMRVKFPWLLEIGDHAWIGEDVWIDNLATVTIAANVCCSQGSYLGTGNHDWSDRAFGIFVEPLVIEEGAWIGMRAVVGPGVRIGSHAVVTAGSVQTTDAEAFGIYRGNPAVKFKQRVING